MIDHQALAAAIQGAIDALRKVDRPHGEAYCSECKLTFLIPKPLDVIAHRCSVDEPPLSIEYQEPLPPLRSRSAPRMLNVRPTLERAALSYWQERKDRAVGFLKRGWVAAYGREHHRCDEVREELEAIARALGVPVGGK